MADVLRRHELVRVHPVSWAQALLADTTLPGLPYLESWALNGWPVMVRRCMPSDVPGRVPVAVALPPGARSRRVALQIAPTDILAREAAVPLADTIAAAPGAWRVMLESVVSLGERHDITPFVFGSILWQHRTGLQYLRSESDLDLLWFVTDAPRAAALACDLSAIAARVPVQIDGEFILPDGGGVHWRELSGNASELLVKTMRGVERRPRASLFDRGSAAA